MHWALFGGPFLGRVSHLLTCLRLIFDCGLIQEKCPPVRT